MKSIPIIFKLFALMGRPMLSVGKNYYRKSWPRIRQKRLSKGFVLKD
jgi:hypothetical protein